MSYSETDIENLLRIFRDSDWDEMYLQIGDLKLDVRRSDDEAGNAGKAALSVERSEAGGAAPVQPRDAAASPAPPPEPSAEPAGPARADGADLVIRAPNLGTFWRQPKPGAPPYVEIGQEIDEETTVCLIEVMKLFTPVKAAMRGRIAEVLAESGQMIESGAPLFRLEATG